MLFRSSSGSNVGKEVLDVLALEGLGEKGGPDGLNVDLGGGGEGVDLVSLRVDGSARASAERSGEETHSDLNALVGKDERGVGGGEFGSGHYCKERSWSAGCSRSRWSALHPSDPLPHSPSLPCTTRNLFSLCSPPARPFDLVTRILLVVLRRITQRYRRQWSWALGTRGTGCSTYCLSSDLNRSSKAVRRTSLGQESILRVSCGLAGSNLVNSQRSTTSIVRTSSPPRFPPLSPASLLSRKGPTPEPPCSATHVRSLHRPVDNNPTTAALEILSGLRNDPSPHSRR